MKNKNIQTEIDACFLYVKLAEHETDPTIANVYRQILQSENGHATALEKKDKISAEE